MSNEVTSRENIINIKWVIHTLEYVLAFYLFVVSHEQKWNEQWENEKWMINDEICKSNKFWIKA
jgi:hypothetical protein